MVQFCTSLAHFHLDHLCKCFFSIYRLLQGMAWSIEQIEDGVLDLLVLLLSSLAALDLLRLAMVVTIHLKMRGPGLRAKSEELNCGVGNSLLLFVKFI
jgi:hypothetical protein